MLIGQDIVSIDEIRIAMEGKWFAKLSSNCPVESVVVLMSLFYAFNLEFPSDMKCLYTFLDYKLPDKQQPKKLPSSIHDLLRKANL